MSNNEQVISDVSWFYEEDGQRNGPISEEEIINFIKSEKISYGSAVWKKGYPDWLKIENTELRTYLERSSPPPLSGDHVNNTLVWVLAFAPILGMLLEYFIAGAIHKNEYAASVAVESGKYWFVTLVLNVVLSYSDENKLRKAGHNTDKFKGMAWLVPVYLYQRAKNLNHNLAYFITWIVSFLFTLLA
ncbi:DUF4339 domain-containing protein [uncultured Deefgea sp.]|uniref:DUF4339 domain-containing protein n=1 Tax=uncultured Deefgea sp. TaxID=1304914 RepID=UPI002601ED86|nr:DUF4339 domain-containing protein [uncultured Deefgea sp.]